jgi:hypothetical protein
MRTFVQLRRLMDSNRDLSSQRRWKHTIMNGLTMSGDGTN